MLVFLGVRGELPQLQHHSLFFTADWTANFNDIFETPTAVPDPASLYVIASSAALFSPSVKQQFLELLPYVATVIAVAGLIGRVRAPAADGVPYDK